MYKPVKLVLLLTILIFSSNTVHSHLTVSADATTTNLDQINILPAWNITQGNPNITVAVIDSGINTTQNLPPSIRWKNVAEINGMPGVDDDHNGYVDDYYGWDFVNQDNTTSTDSSGFSIFPHGSIVSSVIVSPHDAQPFGVAPNVRIMDLRALDVLGAGSFLNIFQAVQYAVDNHADVISMSLGYQNIDIPGGSIIELQHAAAANIPVVVAAGNNASGISEMAKDPNTIAISSVNAINTISSFSSRGDAVDFAAPGEFIPSLDQTGKLVETSGTSLSTPHVAGTIALMLSARNDLPHQYIYEVLKATAKDLGTPGKDQLYGNGLIDAGKAVNDWKNFEKIDFDHDGYTSGAEIAAGTNPFDSADHPTTNSTLGLVIDVSVFAIMVIVLFINRKRISRVLMRSRN